LVLKKNLEGQASPGGNFPQQVSARLADQLTTLAIMISLVDVPRLKEKKKKKIKKKKNNFSKKLWPVQN